MNAIVAVCDDWGIGNQGRLLVRNRRDMQHFVACTMGGTVVMGRKTLDSFPGGRALKGRRNVVITRQPDFSRENVEVTHGIREALDLVAADDRASEVWAIGGETIYRALLPYCARVVVTKNHCTCAADAFFPNLDEDPAWCVASVDETGTTEEGVPFEFVTYERVAG